MNVELYIPFFLATALILILPGPTIILVISQALAHGRMSVVPLVAGVLMGDFTAMTLSILGLGTLLSTSAVLFSLCKWIGAIYLVYLGVQLWRSSPGKYTMAPRTETITSRVLFQRSYIVTALNPKSIAFFVAFLPQFIEPLKPVAPQLVLLGATFLVLATINAALYALFAGRVKKFMVRRSAAKWFHRCGGSALIGAGAFTAAMKSAA